MFGKLRASKVMLRDGKDVKDNDGKSINVHEEYHRALRTKSYADFLTKAHELLANQPSIFSNHSQFSEILLEPSQETIPSLLEHSTILVQTPELKHLILTYFHITALASHTCTHLLKSIKQVHSNYHFVQTALDNNIMYSTIIEHHPSPTNLELIVFQLESYILSENPFSNPAINGDFRIISDKNSSVLQHLKAMRKKVARKIKCIQYTKKASGICVAFVCGLVAIAATVIAAHSLTAIIMGPAIFSFPMKSLRRKLQRFIRTWRSGGLLGKVRDQLDVAAKGSYILKRDLDTMSRLVSRLHDEIERNREMIRFWLGRRKEEKLAMEIVKEVRKSEDGFRKKLEELEEHVYLCLVTINRARALVVKQMTSACT